MPLHQLIPFAGEGFLIIWKVTESHDELASALKARNRADLLPVPLFRYDRRNTEWLTVRMLLTEFIDPKADLYYTEVGKPVLTGAKGHISISHAWPFICLTYHPHLASGVDIERVDGRITRIAHKFISKPEEKWLKHPHELNELYLLWAAKEAAFKLLGGNGIDFRENLQVKPHSIQEYGLAEVEFNKHEMHFKFPLYYRFLDSMILVYTIAENEITRTDL